MAERLLSGLYEIRAAHVKRSSTPLPTHCSGKTRDHRTCNNRARWAVFYLSSMGTSVEVAGYCNRHIGQEPNRYGPRQRVLKKVDYDFVDRWKKERKVSKPKRVRRRPVRSITTRRRW